MCKGKAFDPTAFGLLMGVLCAFLATLNGGISELKVALDQEDRRAGIQDNEIWLITSF